VRAIKALRPNRIATGGRSFDISMSAAELGILEAIRQGAR
jgi:hypothetical protein